MKDKGDALRVSAASASVCRWPGVSLRSSCISGVDLVVELIFSTKPLSYKHFTNMFLFLSTLWDRLQCL